MLLLPWLGQGCQQKQAFHYPEEVLIEVLRDMHIARAALQHVPAEEQDSLYTELFGQICELYAVEENMLLLDMDILLADPAMVERIYQAVIDSLERQPDALTEDY